MTEIFCNLIFLSAVFLQMTKIESMNFDVYKKGFEFTDIRSSYDFGGNLNLIVFLN
jgi:hypothetical protein